MLTDIQKEMKEAVKYLPKKYTQYTIDELANAYCEAVDNKNELNKNIYISALVLRHWYVINKLYQSCKSSGLEYEDFFNWLIDAINLACQYRAWQTKDGVSAEQAIQQCINTVRVRNYYQFNLDKHSVNYGNKCISLDTPSTGEDDGAEVTLGDTMESDEITDEIASGPFDARSLIQGYIDRNKLLEAVILDNIAFSAEPPIKKSKKTVKTTDAVTGETVRYTQHFSEFWSYKLVQTLGKIDDNYTKYFANAYSVNSKALDAVINKVKSSNNQKLYKYVSAVTDNLRETLVF